jgi:hypothetical protein
MRNPYNLIKSNNQYYFFKTREKVTIVLFSNPEVTIVSTAYLKEVIYL